MISFLGSLLGFGSSLIGPVLEAWNKNSDKKHDQADALAISDKIILMEHGAVVQEGSAFDIYHNPNTNRIFQTLSVFRLL